MKMHWTLHSTDSELELWTPQAHMKSSMFLILAVCCSVGCASFKRPLKMNPGSSVQVIVRKTYLMRYRNAPQRVRSYQYYTCGNNLVLILSVLLFRYVCKLHLQFGESEANLENATNASLKTESPGKTCATYLHFTTNSI